MDARGGVERERVIWFDEIKPPGKELSPGVVLECIQPGGVRGPNNEVALPTRGGQVWSDAWVLGSDTDDFKMRIPDVRMPPNQYYPLHYHGCWIAVIVLDGECLVGDWWMGPGDVLISAADVEYGPLVNGPYGCQMFEIFAKEHLGMGGYAPIYADHPTLDGVPKEMTERSELNRRNDGRCCLPIGEAEGDGIWTGQLDPGRVWDLGPADDPDRGAFITTLMLPGEQRAAHSYDDWHTIFVLEGDGKIGNHVLVKNDVLMIQPGVPVQAISAGLSGMKLLEVTRTVKGLMPQF